MAGVGRAQVADPEAAVAGADQDGALPAADDPAWLDFARQAGRGVVREDRKTADLRTHPGGAVGGPDRAKDPFGGVAPVEGAVLLGHERPRLRLFLRRRPE